MAGSGFKLWGPPSLGTWSCGGGAGLEGHPACAPSKGTPRPTEKGIPLAGHVTCPWEAGVLGGNPMTIRVICRDLQHEGDSICVIWSSSR